MKRTLLLLACLPLTAQTTLLDTIRAGDIAALKAALDNGADPNLADSRGYTALHYAALYSTAPAVSLLLQRRADPNKASQAGVTPLMTAIADLDKVRLLVDKGAHVNARSANGAVPVRLAAGLASGAPVAELLLSRGAKPDRAALRVAINRRHAQLARRILAAGVEPDDSVATAAANSGDSALLRIILEKLPPAQPAPANAASRRDALMNASYFGFTEVVAILLERGADVKAKDNRGRTALMYAAGSEFSNAAIVKLLLDRGADASISDTRGDKAIDLAQRLGEMALIQALGGQPMPRAAQAVAKAGSPAGSVRAALGRSLRLLDAAGPGFFKVNSCISCHNQSIPQMAAERTRSSGLEGDPTVAKSQIKAVLGVWGGEVDRMWQTTCTAGGGAIATMTYGLLGLAAANQPPSPTIDLAASCLANVQSPDGRWTMPDVRQPLGNNDIKFTALAIGALQRYPLPGRRAEFAGRIARGRKFIESAQPADTQGHALQVLGMKWTGSDPASIAKAASKLAGLQGADGGWAQRPTMAPDAYATAQAVWALHEGAGYPVTSSIWRRGAEYLRAAQEPDGSWHVRSRGFGFQPYRETGFPHGHDQWISAAATGFAVMALAPLIEPPAASSPAN